jgi:hypothetical protein
MQSLWNYKQCKYVVGSRERGRRTEQAPQGLQLESGKAGEQGAPAPPHSSASARPPRQPWLRGTHSPPSPPPGHVTQLPRSKLRFELSTPPQAAAAALRCQRCWQQIRTAASCCCGVKLYKSHPSRHADLQALVEHALLPLDAHILGPLHKAVKVGLGGQGATDTCAPHKQPPVSSCCTASLAAGGPALQYSSAPMLRQAAWLLLPLPSSNQVSTLLPPLRLLQLPLCLARPQQRTEGLRPLLIQGIDGLARLSGLPDRGRRGRYLLLGCLNQAYTSLVGCMVRPRHCARWLTTPATNCAVHNAGNSKSQSPGAPARPGSRWHAAADTKLASQSHHLFRLLIVSNF